MKVALAVALAVAMTATLSASDVDSPDVTTRAKGAGKVVVGKVVKVHAHFDVNEFGDQLIVSDAEMEIEETLKGGNAAAVIVTLEGGTVGDLKLDVSDMPSMEEGDRAVMFLNVKPNGKNVPSGRGKGVLKLDNTNHVEGTDVSLDDVKRMVRAAR